jgi:large subunit ribosomal protein L10
MDKKKVFREKDIPEYKKEKVKRFAKLLNGSRSVLIVSIKNLPAKQLQLISKKLRGEGKLKVVKKSIITRAIDDVKKGTIKNLKKYLKENIGFLFSNLDPFELSAMLSENKSMAKAKAGQKVDEEVYIQAGPTELTPGPIISELGNLGIQFEIKEGKISIKKRKKLLEEGDEAGEKEVSIMNKFDIKPIKVGLEPLIAYDAEEDELYEDVKVDREETLKRIKERFGRVKAFAVSINYPCKETISFILMKAESHGNAISSLVGGDEKEGGEESKEKNDDKKKEVGKGKEGKEKSEEEEDGEKGGESKGGKESEDDKKKGEESEQGDGGEEGEDDQKNKSKQEEK